MVLADGLKLLAGNTGGLYTVVKGTVAFNTQTARSGFACAHSILKRAV